MTTVSPWFTVKRSGVNFHDFAEMAMTFRFPYARTGSVAGTARANASPTPITPHRICIP